MSSNGRMSTEDFRMKHAPSPTPVLNRMDGRQMVALTGLKNVDYVIQDEMILSNTQGMDFDEAKPITLEGALALDSIAKARMVFHGDEVDIAIAGRRENIGKLHHAYRHVLKVLPTVRGIWLVLIDPETRTLVEGALDLIKRHPENPRKILLMDRQMMQVHPSQASVNMWAIHADNPSRNSCKQPDFKLLKLMESGIDPNTYICKMPDLKPGYFAIQSHKEWTDSLLKFLAITRQAASIVPGSDPKHTQFTFVELDDMLINSLVEEFGALPRFAVMPLQWYEGDAFSSKTDIYEIYASKDTRADTAPWLFSHLLNWFWEGSDTLKEDSGIALQTVSYNKVRLGINATTKERFINKLMEQKEQLGLRVKDEQTGFFVNERDIRMESELQSTVSSKFGSSQAVYITDVPPYWDKSDLMRVIAQTNLCEGAEMARMSWSVGELRTHTWKVCHPEANKLNGIIAADYGRSQVVRTISSEEYARCRSKPAQTDPKKRKEQTAQKTTSMLNAARSTTIQFKRKRESSDGTIPAGSVTSKATSVTTNDILMEEGDLLA